MEPKTKNSDAPKIVPQDDAESAEGGAVPPAAPAPVNLQKRDYPLDATRYGDWELNGRCVDF